MDIEIKHRNKFYICGYTVETTLENNDADISRLYSSFFGTEKERSLPGLPGCRPGYYGLEWYTEGHKSFFYLLGREVSGECGAPEGSLLKSVPPAEYAAAKFPAGSSLIEAWTEFFNSAIPAAGYAPDEKHGFYFEYYPEDVRGVFELWTPVIKQYDRL